LLSTPNSLPGQYHLPVGQIQTHQQTGTDAPGGGKLLLAIFDSMPGSLLGCFKDPQNNYGAAITYSLFVNAFLF
jgi:hypothetical protein